MNKKTLKKNPDNKYLISFFYHMHLVLITCFRKLVFLLKLFKLSLIHFIEYLTSKGTLSHSIGTAIFHVFELTLKII